MTRTAKLSFVTVVLGTAVVGAAAGFVTGAAYQAKANRAALALFSGRIVVAEARDLERAYGTADRALQVHALDHFAQTLELIEGEVSPLVGEKGVRLDLALTYARLGLLHRASGDTRKAKQSLEKAVTYFPVKNGRRASEEEIIQYVLKLDRGLKQGDVGRGS